MTDTAAQAGLRIRGLHTSYGSLRVIEDLDLTLEPGHIYGLLGPNGAGKTTLMSVICNHAFRDAGSILIDGEDPAENARILARTCFVRENQPYNEILTVASILEVLPSFYPDWDDALCRRLMAAFQLPAERRARKLSRGQKSALAIVISLASRAPYTFVDEPYLGLDPTAREVFYAELAADFAEHPRTIVMSTHLVDEAADLMEEVVVLHQGRVVLQENVDEARHSAFVARGLADEVRALVAGHDVLAERPLGGILSVTARGRLSAVERERATAARISVEPASLQDLIAALGIHDLTSLLAEGDAR